MVRDLLGDDAYFWAQDAPDLTEISLERTRQRAPQANDEQRKKENEVVRQRLHFCRDPLGGAFRCDA
jgi:hypothetical protein